MNNRFLHDAKFHNLVMWLAKVVNDGLFTMQDLHDALEAAQHRVHPTYGTLPASDVWTTPEDLLTPVVRLDPPISG